MQSFYPKVRKCADCKSGNYEYTIINDTFDLGDEWGYDLDYCVAIPVCDTCGRRSKDQETFDIITHEVDQTLKKMYVMWRDKY